jgi:hypothetical protein
VVLYGNSRVQRFPEIPNNGILHKISQSTTDKLIDIENKNVDLLEEPRSIQDQKESQEATHPQA